MRVGGVQKERARSFGFLIWFGYIHCMVWLSARLKFCGSKDKNYVAPISEQNGIIRLEENR